LSALELELFTKLDGTGMTALELQNALGLHSRANPDFFDALVEFGDAFDFTGADFSHWCREAGFKRCEVIPLGGPASAGVAYK
jgi:hypothetical protein